MTDRVMSDKGLEFMDELPPFYSEDPNVQGAEDALGREYQRVEDQGTALLDQGFPQYADDTVGALAAWESTVGLPQAPVGQTLSARRRRVLSRLRRRGDVSGLAWEDAITDVLGPGTWSYTENTPGSYQITVVVPYAFPMASPTGLATTPSTTGGTLAAATYRYKVTATDAYGETLPGSEVSGVTTGSTSKVTLNWTAVAGATGYKVYRSTSPGTEIFMVATTTNSYVDTGSVTPAGSVPPSGNTSGSYEAGQMAHLLAEITPAHLQVILTHGTGFIVGVSQVGVDTI